MGRTQQASADGPRPSPAGGHTNPPASAPAVQGSSTQGSTAQASVSQAPTSSAPSATPVAVQALAPASVTAFGPAGRGDGDDPQRAALAIGGDRARPWISQWYATARFGALKQGTGLLLDMGRPVTVASVGVSLVNSGADIQLRAGSKPVPAWLPVVAHVSNAGRTAQLKPAAPVHVRYLLIWFTKLPPDNAGHYQAGVYRITVQGHR